MRMKLPKIPAGKLVQIGYVVVASMAILAISIFVFIPILRTFFVFDDATLIRNLRHFKYFVKHLTSDWGGGFYRPLINLFFYFDYRVWGKNPFGYHLTNVAVHALNGLLVFWLATRLTRDKRIGWLSGLLFAVHPAHAEAVSWISGRMDVVCSSFYLAALLAFDAYRSSRKHLWQYALSLGCFVLALMTKELAVTLPGAIILYDLCAPVDLVQRRWSSRRGPSWENRVWIYSPFILVFTAYWGFRWLILGRIGGYGTHLSLEAFDFNTLILYANNLLHVVQIPFPQSVQQGPLLIVMALFLTSVFGLLFFSSPKPVKFALGLTIITLLPAWNMFGHRFQYLPSVGVILALAFLVIRSLDRLFSRQVFRGFAQAIIGGCLLVLLAQGLRDANLWFVQAGELNNPHKLLTLYPDIPKNAQLFFRGIPPVFNLRFAETLNWYFEEFTVRIEEIAEFSEAASPEKISNQYFFQYHHGELYDVTQWVRQQHTPTAAAIFADIPPNPKNVITLAQPDLVIDLVDLPGSTQLNIVTALGNGTQMAEDTPVARITVTYADDAVAKAASAEYDLRVGAHTADWAMEKPGIAEHVQYTRPAIWESRTVTDADGGVFKANKYLAVFPLNAAQIPVQVRITFIHPDADVSLEVYQVMCVQEL